MAANPVNASSPDNNPNIKPLPYDPQRAGQLLDEAGWKDHDGDGIRDKDGVPFRFELLGSVGSAFSDQLLPIVKESFRKAGIDVIERKLEFTVQIEQLKDHKFDAQTSAWVSGLVLDPYQLWHSSSIANRGSNYISFRNPESDKLLEDARVEFEPENASRSIGGGRNLWRMNSHTHCCCIRWNLPDTANDSRTLISCRCVPDMI